MRLFTVYLRRDGLDMDNDMAVVKEGFSWPGFLFFTLWALSKKMWLWAAVVFIVETMIVSGLEQTGMDALTVTLLLLIANWGKGVFANDLYRRKLEKQGFVLAGAPVASNPDQALFRVLLDDRGYQA